MDLNERPESPGMRLGFQTPQTGTYFWEIQEGIDVWRSEDTDSTAIMVPMKVDSVSPGDDGDPESTDRGATYFITMISKEGKRVSFGEKQVVNLLACVGMLDKFAKKYKGDVDPLDERFINDLKLRLPGKFVKARVETVEKNGHDRCNFMTMEPMRSSKSSRSVAGKAETQRPRAETPKPGSNSDDDDW